jgi:microcystin synthetase protein McyJ
VSRLSPVRHDTEWLHAGGRPGAWGNLGLWDAATPDYFGACRALASAVAQAAGCKPGDRVLAVACGAGEELRVWQQDFGIADVVGVEADPARARRARALAPGTRVLEGSGTALLELGLPEAHFDRVLCVDAAYHLQPRQTFLQAARRLLRPGGTLAYTDLVAERAHPVLRGAARLCGLHQDALLPAAAQQRRLLALGYTDVTIERLDEAVLGGFARFVRGQNIAPWRWPRVATTAALIGPCRAAGLGYAMLSATASAERTALSSSGTPGIA